MNATTTPISLLPRIVPFALLILLVLSFGLMIPWLGYGHDEWHFIYYSTRGAQGLTELFHFDGHPQATWSYIQSFKIVGYSPLYWHLYSLFWRWLAVLSFWLCLKSIWPDAHRQNFFVAALFAIYPVFTLQVYPITFFEIWFGYTLLFLSFFFTILAVQRPEKRRSFMLLAILLAVGHIFTKEYAWFVEWMRPVFIWLVLPSRDVLSKKLSQIARIWFPFFLIFVSYVVWRGFLYTPLRRAFRVESSLFANPLSTMLGWIVNLLPDLSIVLITSWFETFRAEYFYLVRPFAIAMLLLMALVIVTIGVYVRKLDGAYENADLWASQAFFLGLPSLLFGILPFYVASYQIHLTETPVNSRFAIGMLPGAALILAAIIEKTISKPNLRIWITAILLGLAVGWHLRYTNDYRAIWAYQSNMLQQVTWRIPGLEENTALFIWQPSPPALSHPDPGIALYEDSHVSMGINSIFQIDPDPADSRVSYWYYYLSGDSIDLPNDTPLEAAHATTYFNGNTRDSLFLYYDPQNGRCLHVVNVEDQYYKQYPETIKKISPSVTANRILLTEAQNTELRDEIWIGGQETWCFYYQKAELARQFGQWEKIPPLWRAAADRKLNTAFGAEYIPFIDGFARTGQWQTAIDMTLRADKLSKGMDSILCPLWTEIGRSMPASEEKDEALGQLQNVLGCVEQ